ncbi:MAG: DUF5123 domain-containing protein, partial [Acidobacteriaceae bacterium]|nr:DUF5123 domain-containing protein [Acidobacteriaceae bacterium]
PSHHQVYINNIVHDCGSAGIASGWGDYYFVVNNLVYRGSGPSYWNEGGGIDAYEMKDATRWSGSDPYGKYGPYNTGYVHNQADTDMPYHVVIAFNVVHDNLILPSLDTCPTAPKCGVAVDSSGPTDSHSDGNGIMFDNLEGTQSDNISFPFHSIALGNLSYNNGGAGILVGTSDHVTVANNSVYNNFTDDEIKNTQRGDIDCLGKDSLFVNNAVYAVVGTGTYTKHNSAFLYFTSTNTVYNNNIGYPSVTGTIPGSNNLFGNTHDPLFTDAPNGDFTLQTGSPALGSGLSDATTPWLTSATPNIGFVQP